MKDAIISTFVTPAGLLEVTYDEHYVYRATFAANDTEKSRQSSKWQLGDLIAAQINSYSKNPHHRFLLPLKPLGSAYRQHVWNALLVIPVGRTVTYGELAATLQTSPRAVGQACKNNPLALFIPCHRVVGKDNQGGYMGRSDALHYKMSLLQHENT